MAPIVSGIDTARPPDEVFFYVTDPSRFVEWQDGEVSGHTEGDAPAAVGTRCIMTRRIGGSERTMASEVTEISRPRTWAIRGIDGPVRAAAKVTVEPRRNDQQSHVTISLDFTGHGFGKMLVPVVVAGAAGGPRELPEAEATPRGHPDFGNRLRLTARRNHP